MTVFDGATSPSLQGLPGPSRRSSPGPPVEEKILELQQTRRELADAILTESNNVIRTIRREDLELLLS